MYKDTLQIFKTSVPMNIYECVRQNQIVDVVKPESIASA